MKNRARDPHDVLGVAEGAEIDEIKKQFRARAKALHPDTSDGTASEDAFHELKAAPSPIHRTRCTGRACARD